MLSEKSLAIIDHHLLLMRFILAGLVLGVVVFGAFAIANPDGIAQPANIVVDWFMAAFGVATGIAGWIVPRLIPVGASAPPPPAPDDVSTELRDTGAIMGGRQTAMIVACAIFEGGAFANIFWYYSQHQPLHLAVASVLLLFMLLQFPRRGAILDVVEGKLRQQREARQLSAMR